MSKEDQLRALIHSAHPHIQRHFACDCAERALQKTNADDIRLWNAIAVSRLFAEGRTNIDALGAARDAVQDVPWHAMRKAVWFSAWHITPETAWHTAVHVAAWSVARPVAWNTKLREERNWQIEHLQSLIAAHNAARSSLLHILQKRSESIKPVFVRYAHALEERAFG